MGNIMLKTEEARDIKNKLATLNKQQQDIYNSLNSKINEMNGAWTGEIPGACANRLLNTKTYALTITTTMDRYVAALDSAVRDLEEADRRIAEQAKQAAAAAAAAAGTAGAAAGATGAAAQSGQQIPRDSAAYSANGGNPFARGQCTWYAWGRVKEITGKNVNFSRDWGRDAKNWPSLITNGVKKSVPESGCVMVNTSGQYGHVAVVERVESLPNGDYRIFYSEANNDGDVYNENPETDGLVSDILLSEMWRKGFDTILAIT